MTDMQRVDANLIVVLDAILEHRNLTRAGEALGMAQPTMSGALSRLRARLGDRILVREGRTSVLTPFAEQLIPSVRRAIAEIEQLYAVRTRFDPGASQRFFLVTAPADVVRDLAAPVAAILRAEAPSTTVDFDDAFEADHAAWESLLQRRDAVIGVAGLGGMGRTVSLYTDRLVVVVDAHHPLLHDGRIATEDLDTLTQITGAGGVYTSRAAEMLAAERLSPRRIVAGAPVLHLARMVAGTTSFAIVPERVAERLRDDGILIADAGLRPPTIVHAAHWHPSRADDSAVQWFLGVLRRAAERVEFPDGVDEPGA